MTMKKPFLQLYSIDDELHEAWGRHFGDVDGVSVIKGDILAGQADAIVSPANSYGWMDGGIDLLYSELFGWDLQERLQKIIEERHNGELPVGKAEILETGNSSYPHMISAPTMKIPMALDEDTANPLHAAQAAFQLVKEGRFVEGKLKGQLVRDRVTSIAMPGFGTGAGRVLPETCARQVRIAYDRVFCR